MTRSGLCGATAPEVWPDVPIREGNDAQPPSEASPHEHFDTGDGIISYLARRWVRASPAMSLALLD